MVSTHPVEGSNPSWCAKYPVQHPNSYRCFRPSLEGLFYCGAKSGRLVGNISVIAMKMMRRCNAQEEVACQALVKGMTQADAYREAYPRSQKWKPTVVAVKSCELFGRDHVAARVAELQEKNAKRNQITVDTLLAELEENRQAALCAETPQAAAATAATMGKAKLLGLDKQIIEHTGPGGSALTPTVIQLVGPADDDSEA